MMTIARIAAAFGAVAVLGAAPLAATGMVTVASAEPDYSDCMVYEPKSPERLSCMDQKLRADTASSAQATPPLAPATVTVTPSYAPTTTTAPTGKGNSGFPLWGWVLIVIGALIAAPFVIGAIVTAGALGRDAAAERRDLYDDDDDDDDDDDWDVTPSSAAVPTSAVAQVPAQPPSPPSPPSPPPTAHNLWGD